MSPSKVRVDPRSIREIAQLCGSTIPMRFLVVSPSVRDLSPCAKHLFFAAKAAIVLAEAQGRARKACSTNWSANARPIGMGCWSRSTWTAQRGLITALGPWQPPRGSSNGQASLPVRHRSSAERRWVKSHRASALAALTRSTPSSRLPPRKTPRIPELHTDEA